MTFVPPSSPLLPALGSLAVLGVPLTGAWAIIQDVPGLNLLERYGIFGLFAVSLLYAFVTGKGLAERFFGKILAAMEKQAQGSQEVIAELRETRADNKLLRVELAEWRKAEKEAREAAVEKLMSALPRTDSRPS